MHNKSTKSSKLAKPIKVVKKSFKYKKLCAYDRKCFTHKDTTNKMFCDMILKNLSKTKLVGGEEKKILCLDSSIRKTSNMLISKNITNKNNILLIEANKNTYQKHMANGYNCLFGDCKNILSEYKFGYQDGIYLDAIGSVETVGQMVFDTVNNIIKKNNIKECVLGYTFVKRGNKLGQKFTNSHNTFQIKLKELLEKFEYSITDSNSYSYGNPRIGQANMFTEFICIKKN